MRFPSSVLIVSLTLIAFGASAHEWATDPKTRHWFQSLTQPDNPYQSCCGEADSYLSDQFEVDEKGDYIAIITDERDDLVPEENADRHQDDDGGVTGTGPHYRQHRAVGTRIHVPAVKVGCTKPNPTGHGILFMPQMGESLRGHTEDDVDHAIYDGAGKPLIPYCYCPPTMS